MKYIGLLILIISVTTSCVSTNGDWTRYTSNNKGSAGNKSYESGHKYNHLVCKKHKNKHKKKHKKSLPPGLRKKVAKGKPLPPGWQKKVNCGEVLDPVIYQNAIVLDIDEYPNILRYNPAAEVIKVRNKIIRIMKDTHEVLDILD